MTGSKAVRKEAKHRSLRREMEVQIKAFGVVGTDVETSSQGSHDRVRRVTDSQDQRLREVELRHGAMLYWGVMWSRCK